MQGSGVVAPTRRKTATESPTRNYAPSNVRPTAEDEPAEPLPSSLTAGLPIEGGSSYAASSEGYFVANAGVVILHPYLKYLLERTDALQPDGRPDYGRAALLLHYVVFGEGGQPEEWDLPLTKLLLGLAPEELLIPNGVLSAADRATINDLLKGVIGHWSVLKATSPDGLRETFLQRTGKLALGPVGYTLTVEAVAFDLLLDQLPWGIGLVKSPWMAAPLQVNWR